MSSELELLIGVALLVPIVAAASVSALWWERRPRLRPLPVSVGIAVWTTIPALFQGERDVSRLFETAVVGGFLGSMMWFYLWLIVRFGT